MTGVNAVLAPYFAKINNFSFKILGSGEVCTCCKNGVKGLKATGEVSFEVEAGGVLGFQREVEFARQIPGVGDVHAKAELLIGGEILLKGAASGKLETECFLEDPKFCLSGSISTEVFIGVKGEVELTATAPDGTKTKGGAKAAGGVQFGGSIEFSGCNDTNGMELKACFDGIVLKGEFEGSLPGPGGSDKYVKLELTSQLVSDRCTSNLLERSEAILAGTRPATLGDTDAAGLAGAMGYPSTGDLIKNLTGVSVPDLPSGATTDDLSRALGEAKRKGASGDPVSVSKEEPVKAAAGGSICAQVRIQIEQEAVLTRKAIGANLEVDNNSATDPLEELNVTIMIYDAQGNVVNNRFVILDPELAGIMVLPPLTNGPGDIRVTLDQWRIPVNATGRARWVILPLDDAAPTAPVTYCVGGFMTYSSGGVPDGVIFERVPVQVYPNANLHLRYFHERDVFSDDPFTDEIEPSVPYSLAVMVYGNTTPSTVSPRIRRATWKTHPVCLTRKRSPTSSTPRRNSLRREMLSFPKPPPSPTPTVCWILINRPTCLPSRWRPAHHPACS